MTSNGFFLTLFRGDQGLGFPFRSVLFTMQVFFHFERSFKASIFFFYRFYKYKKSRDQKTYVETNIREYRQTFQIWTGTGVANQTNVHFHSMGVFRKIKMSSAQKRRKLTK